MIRYSEYKLWERELLFKQQNEEPARGNYAIVWEDPAELDAPANVTIPAPYWLAMAMHGGILPPVEAYWALAEDEARDDFTRHTRGHLLHEAPPVPAMTEEEAMEYLVMKDLPPRVWRDYKGNRCILKIVPFDLVPTDRVDRNAWKIKQEAA